MSARDGLAWVDDYYAATDAKDLDRVLAFWAADGRLAYRGQDAVGLEAVKAVVQGTFDGFASMRHQIVNRWRPEQDVAVVEVRVTYERMDGVKVPLEGVLIGRVDGERWLEQRIYVDTAPLLEAAPAAAA